MKIQVLVLGLSLIVINGCAAKSGNIIVDHQGVDMTEFKFNLGQCEEIATQASSKVGKGIVGGAVVGAIAGNIVGNSKTRRKGAKLGALGGLIKGAIATKRERTIIVKNCLRNRGYAVLN